MRWQKKTLPQANLDTALNMMSLVACYCCNRNDCQANSMRWSGGHTTALNTNKRPFYFKWNGRLFVFIFWFKKRAYDRLLSNALSLQFSCLAHVLLL